MGGKRQREHDEGEVVAEVQPLEEEEEKEEEEAAAEALRGAAEARRLAGEDVLHGIDPQRLAASRLVQTY